jgi:hypothetical protein
VAVPGGWVTHDFAKRPAGGWDPYMPCGGKTGLFYLVGDEDEGFPILLSECAAQLAIGPEADEEHPEVYSSGGFSAIASVDWHHVFRGGRYHKDEQMSCWTGEPTGRDRGALSPPADGTVASVAGRTGCQGVDYWQLTGTANDQVVLRLVAAEADGDAGDVASDDLRHCLADVRTGRHGGNAMWSGRFRRDCTVKISVTLGLDERLSDYVLEAQRKLVSPLHKK